MKKISNEKIDKFVFYFSVIDIIFLPYIWFVSTNYSMVVLLVWYCYNIKKTKETKTLLTMSFLMILGTAVSIIIYPQYIGGNEIWITNIKTMFQFVSYFIYFAMFKYCIQTYNLKIKKLLIISIIFASAFGVVYMINKDIFANIKIYWNNVDSFTNWHNTNISIQYRYNFIWTDPNNVAYLFVSVMGYLILNEKTNIIERFTIIVLTAFIVICTMSTGGAICFIIIFGSIVLSNIPKSIKAITNVKIKLVSIIKFLVVCTILVVIGKVYANIIVNPTYREALKRIEENKEVGSTSRFVIWKNILEQKNIMKNIFIGEGGKQVIINGTIKSTHNGHLYLIYAYGMIFYFIFMYYFFRKKTNVKFKEYMFVVPILIGFTINIMLGEQKCMIIYILLYSTISIVPNKIKESMCEVEKKI